MAFVTWLRALNAVGTVADATRMFRGRGAVDSSPAPVDDTGALETRLANVVVAALREAFDRDRTRLDLERDFHRAEQLRNERALRLEWLRQTGTHALDQTRHLVVLSVVVWIASAAAAGWLAPLGEVSKWCLGLGWVTLGAAVAAAFLTHQHLTTWLAQRATDLDTPPELPGMPKFTAQTWLPWLFLGGFLLSALSLAAEL